MTREELGNNISANIASVTMGCTNIEVTSAIMRDVDLYASRPVKKTLTDIVLRAMQAKVGSDTYGVSHAIGINTDRAGKAADEILAALERPSLMVASQTRESEAT